MTAETDLLPLPEKKQLANPYAHSFGSVSAYGHTDDTLRDYARANVARAIVDKDAEIDALRTLLEDTVRDSTNKIEALRAEVAEWKRVAAAQAELHCEAEERAERLAQAARGWMEQALSRRGD
jgi:hypothetical protein